MACLAVQQADIISSDGWQTVLQHTAMHRFTHACLHGASISPLTNLCVRYR
jgi:hypothetical protein